MGTIAKSLSLAKPVTRTSQRHIPVLLHAPRIMSELEESQQGLVPQAIHEKLSVPKSTAFRILKTLVHRGYAIGTTDGVYKSCLWLDGSFLQPCNYISWDAVSYPSTTESERRLTGDVSAALLKLGDTTFESTLYA